MSKIVYCVCFSKLGRVTESVISDCNLFFVEAYNENEAAKMVVKRFSNSTTKIEIDYVEDIELDPVHKDLYKQIKAKEQEENHKFHWERLSDFIEALWNALVSTFQLLKLLVVPIIVLIVIGNILWDIWFK